MPTRIFPDRKVAVGATNSFARRIRLGKEVQKLRESRRETQLSLVKRCGVSQSFISKLENPVGEIGRLPDVSIPALRTLLDALGVERGSDQWARFDWLAETSASTGWWTARPYAKMGDGQRAWAAIEYGAEEISDYAVLLMPGLVQTPEYAEVCIRAGGVADADVCKILEGRLRRQEETVLSGRTRYNLVLEPQAVYRSPGQASLMRDQLQHLLNLAERPNISVRVLQVGADISGGGGTTPRSPSTHYTYPDRDDPQVATIDTDTTDLIVIDVDQVTGYAQLHQRLRRAALSDADSVTLIAEAADMATNR